MDDITLIKNKLDLVDVIESYIPIKRAGRNFKTVCPFHNEKSPSFVISPERQIWHCFGCGKGGDMFTFVEEYERLDFSEALKLLAEKAGVRITKNVFKTQQEEKKNKIYEINHLSSQFYHYLLTTHSSGKQALSYVIEKRKLTPALLETYSIGFAPRQPSALTSYLIKKKGYTNQELVDAGVAVFRNGRTYDFFQNRLIFPIMDSRGNIVAFSGRGITDNAIPKYINTKETAVYIKGDTLFGLFQAKEAMKKEKKVILMEGEFDVITSFKEGVTNAVAVKGTALTENQIRLLKRFVQKIIFCFDTDSAGTEAQRRSISLIGKENINAGVIIPPQGKDPDELLNENPLLFKKAVKEEVNVYDYIIDTATKEKGPFLPDEKKNILTKTLPVISEIENEIVKEHYYKKLADFLDTSFESITKEAEKLKRPTILQEKIVKPQNKKKRQEMIEEHLLTLILQSQNPKISLEKTLNILDSINLNTPALESLFSFLKKYFENNEQFDIEKLNLQLPKELSETFDLCFLAPLSNNLTDETYEHEIEKTAKDVKQSSIKEKMKTLSEKIRLEEKEGRQESLKALQEEFNSLASHFKA
jgi:DNA primase